MEIKNKPAACTLLLIIFFICIATPKLIGQNSESLKLAKESQHFTFYSTKSDNEVLDSLAITLENNYSRITNHLGIQIEKKINVKVYPDLKSFHIAINYPNAQDWVVGSSINDELLLVSPLNPGNAHTYQSLMQVIVHEFTHIAIYYAREEKASNDIPRWLNEGYAQYEAGQINEHIRKVVKSKLTDKTTFSWIQLETASAMEFGKMNGYGFSATIVEFLIVTFGIDKLVLLIKEPEKLETIYGLSQESLEKQWARYVKAFQIE